MAAKVTISVSESRDSETRIGDMASESPVRIPRVPTAGWPGPSRTAATPRNLRIRIHCQVARPAFGPPGPETAGAAATIRSLRLPASARSPSQQLSSVIFHFLCAGGRPGAAAGRRCGVYHGYGPSPSRPFRYGRWSDPGHPHPGTRTRAPRAITGM